MEQTRGGRQTNVPEAPNQVQKNEGGNRSWRGKPLGRGRGGRGRGRGRGGSSNLHSPEKDTPEVRTSKTLSWLLRHGAASQGLDMRTDGYVKVDDLLKNKRIQSLGLKLEDLKAIVRDTAYQRFSLVFESADGNKLAYTAVGDESHGEGEWLIRAIQGHSLETVQVEVKPILSVSDIPSGLVVYGMASRAWEIVQQEGLAKKSRDYIQLTQRMIQPSEIFISVNVQKALAAGIKFYLADNGAVLTEGDENGYLKPEFFERVDYGETREAGSGGTPNEAVAI